MTEENRVTLCQRRSQIMTLSAYPLGLIGHPDSQDVKTLSAQSLSSDVLWYGKGTKAVLGSGSLDHHMISRCRPLWNHVELADWGFGIVTQSNRIDRLDVRRDV